MAKSIQLTERRRKNDGNLINVPVYVNVDNIVSFVTVKNDGQEIGTDVHMNGWYNQINPIVYRVVETASDIHAKINSSL